MKKIVCALLVALMTLSVFAACAEQKKSTGAAQQNTNGGAVQTAAQTASDSNLDEWGRELVESSVPADKKFDGGTVNFVVDSSKAWELIVDSLNGDLINDAIYNRNLKVEADLGVTVNFITSPGSADTSFASNVSRVVLSGTGDYDLIAGYAYFLTSVVRNWCYANLKDVEDGSSLDLSKPWWNQFYVSEATLNNQIYTVTGDLSVSSNSYAGCIFFNKRLADEHLSAWGGAAGLYKLVEDGEWTFDKFTEICKDVYNDADADGVKSEGDFYAFADSWRGPIPSDAFQYGMDARITRKGDDGVPYLDYNSVRMADVMSKLHAFNNDSAGVFYASSHYNNGSIDTVILNKFINGSLVFYAEVLASAGSFGDMTDDFGLLPMPKYNKEQDKYYTSQSDGYAAFAVAADVLDERADKCDMVGTTLEKLCEESYRSVAPNFFETVMKYRYLRTDADNQKDIKMYDIILSGNNFNFGLIYSSMLDNISFGCRYMIGRDNSADIASFWGSREATVTARFENLIEELMED
ncbi:MAG: hypothetical protein IJV00_05795 [Clostridia bacterium]|nr:hypothetical protein [Clostridia bacterium]